MSAGRAKRTIRRVARSLDSARFRLFSRGRHETDCTERVLGAKIAVGPGILNPALFRTGPLLARAVLDVAGRGTGVLDMGAGSGVVAVVAAMHGARAVAVDLNPDAVATVVCSASLNDVAVDARCGDLFEPIRADERFDVIAFNPPFFEGAARPDLSDGLNLAMFDAPGLPILSRFLVAARDHLSPDGCILIAGSTEGALDQMRALYAEHGYRWHTVHQRERLSERLSVDRLA